jgi:hypothetical protein
VRPLALDSLLPPGIPALCPPHSHESHMGQTNPVQKLCLAQPSAQSQPAPLGLHLLPEPDSHPGPVLQLWIHLLLMHLLSLSSQHC